ncbi:MAG TPA: thiamine phosphate synthase [Cellvibrio sp.]|nr:thiamine phosphate synthase [Cellvibrio sp.]
MNHLITTPLYAITDSLLMPGKALFVGVTAALEGGCRLIQYRDKSGNKAQRLADAEKLLNICQGYDAQLIINDDVQLAKTIGAQGVHLGQDDGNPSIAREYLGANAIIGVTCHASLPLAQRAIKQGASYVAFGRFFPSNTKPDAPPAPLSLLTEARDLCKPTPIVAIGGITLENGVQVLEAGANILAVSHSLFAAADIKRQAQTFFQLQADIKQR